MQRCCQRLSSGLLKVAAKVVYCAPLCTFASALSCLRLLDHVLHEKLAILRGGRLVLY